MRRGFLLGKFLPFHAGHRYLIDFARHHCDRLTVLVCSLPDDPIPGPLRHAWVRDTFPGVEVIHFTEVVQQAPHGEHDTTFWDQWRGIVLEACPAPTHVYASEPYGARLAAEVGAQFVPVDIARELVPISGEAIRADPLRHWAFLPEITRPHFVRRVVLHGPESSGKSTLSRLLAAHFSTVYMHEYARPYLAQAGDGMCHDEAQILAIARGQRAGEEATAPRANRVLLIDTDTVTTCAWSHYLFGAVPDELTQMATGQTRHLDLLLAPARWVDDGTRVQADDAERQHFHDDIARRLNALGRLPVLLSGSWDQRLSAAINAIEGLLGERPAPSLLHPDKGHHPPHQPR